MNRIQKNSIISLAIFTLFVAFVAYSIKNRFNEETSKMKPLPSGQILNEIFACRDDYVNFFIYQKNGQLIAFDSGLNEKNAAYEMRKIGLNPKGVKHVFLTHSDADHCGGVKAFDGAKIYISKKEEALVNGEKKRALIFSNKLDAKYSTVDNGETFNISGIEIRVVPSPGHTPGSVSYLVDGKYLFCGDLLSIADGRAALFNEYFNMDSNVQKESIAALAGTAWEYIFTSHYGYAQRNKNIMKDFVSKFFTGGDK